MVACFLTGVNFCSIISGFLPYTYQNYKSGVVCVLGNSVSII